jgi:hypothetical protein
MWTGKANAWIRELAPGSVGKVGEDLVLELVGGARSPNNKSGYDISCGEMLIEVKLSTVVVMSGYPILVWRQIRPDDPYTHICFIAVYPEDVRAFLVPKEEIPSDVMKHQHGRDARHDIFQIHTRNVNDLFPWMVEHEIK